ncbi:hypothetical protein ACFC1T_09015 [Kitasatospora sp. NPDC056076]|uniref:hypothetical protein n=1 Tax=Kitasatospora sp. NPDC056076 TaxID=3345703 RepID=UPI0035DDE1E2
MSAMELGEVVTAELEKSTSVFSPAVQALLAVARATCEEKKDQALSPYGAPLLECAQALFQMVHDRVFLKIVQDEACTPADIAVIVKEADRLAYAAGLDLEVSARLAHTWQGDDGASAPLVLPPGLAQRLVQTRDLFSMPVSYLLTAAVAALEDAQEKEAPGSDKAAGCDLAAAMYERARVLVDGYYQSSGAKTAPWRDVLRLASLLRGADRAAAEAGVPLAVMARVAHLLPKDAGFVGMAPR